MPCHFSLSLQVDVSEFEAYFERHLAAHGEAENNILIDWFADLAKKVHNLEKKGHKCVRVSVSRRSGGRHSIYFGSLFSIPAYNYQYMNNV